MAGMMNGLSQSLAHQSCSGDGTIQARVIDHLNNRMNTSSLFTHQVRPRLRELNFAGGVGAVAHLVLEPLDVEVVALAGGRPSRHEVAGETLRRLRQDQKRVTHGSRNEPFVAGNKILSRTANAFSDCGIGTD